MTKYIFILLLIGCGGISENPKIKELEKFAKSYTIVDSLDVGYNGRNRAKYFIKTDAKTFEEICGTAIKASREILKSKNLHVVYILFKPAPDDSIAWNISYAPDGMGNGGGEKFIWELEKHQQDASLKFCVDKKN